MKQYTEAEAGGIFTEFFESKIELNDSILRLYYLNGSSFIVKQYMGTEADTSFNEIFKEKNLN